MSRTPRWADEVRSAMMPGNSVFIWNQATMREVVEFYLNNVVFKVAGEIQVTGVAESSNRNDGTFTISVARKEDK